MTQPKARTDAAATMDGMSCRPSPLPADLGESFSYRSARAAGVSARRLRHPDLAAPFRGARMRPAAHDDEPTDDPRLDGSPYALEARRAAGEIARRARALATIAAPDWFFSHTTAAVLWGLPVPLRLLRAAVGPARVGARRRTAGIDVAVLTPGRASRAAGVRGHQLSAVLASVRTVHGLRVSSPATTWALLAAELTVDELIELGDAIVQIPRQGGMRRGGESDALATIAQLVAAADAPYRRAAGKLRDALAEVRVGSSSVAETRIRRDCQRAGLPSPELDFDVFTAEGEAIGYTELAHPRYRLLIEYEGDHHRTDRAQWQRDVDKHTACAAAGWEVLRLTARHVYPSTAPAVERIRAALIRHGWQP